MGLIGNSRIKIILRCMHGDAFRISNHEISARLILRSNRVSFNETSINRNLLESQIANDHAVARL